MRKIVPWKNKTTMESATTPHALDLHGMFCNVMELRILQDN
jgi:hypothetical protein